jgi:hypothetical protein
MCPPPPLETALSLCRPNMEPNSWVNISSQIITQSLMRWFGFIYRKIIKEKKFIIICSRQGPKYSIENFK